MKRDILDELPFIVGGMAFEIGPQMGDPARGEMVGPPSLAQPGRALKSSPAALLARDDQARPIIAAVDRANAVELAQLAFVLETLAASPGDSDERSDKRSQ